MSSVLFVVVAIFVHTVAALPGNICPQDAESALYREMASFLQGPRPLYLSEEFGSRLLANMLAQQGACSNLANHHFLVENCRDGFFDPNRRKGAGRGNRNRGGPDTNYHVGYLKETLNGVAENVRFQNKLADLLQRLRAIQVRLRPQEEHHHVHVLFWCTQGVHRSVAWCRILEAAVANSSWENFRSKLAVVSIFWARHIYYIFGRHKIWNC